MNDEHLQLYSLIQQFISRQEIVFHALKELRPRILISTGALPKEELLNPRINFPQLGFWGEDNNWKYFIHGIGCLLIHTITKEPIEWDAPNLNSFDRHWFINWLKWYLEVNKDNKLPRLAKVKNSDDLDAVIINLLQKLEAQKLIMRVDPQYPHQYTLAIITN